MRILHISNGWEKWNGAANIARMIMSEQEAAGHTVSFGRWVSRKELRDADEVWVHCGWTPCLWWANLWAKNAVRMPEACYDPVRLKFSAWKKRLAGPVERWALRRCKKIVATCEAEKRWIEAYVGKKCPAVEVTDVKRFFKLRVGELVSGGVGECENTSHVLKNSAPLPLCTSAIKNKLHLLYLGRRHPLKGVEFLEQAVAEILTQRSRGAEKQSRYEGEDGESVIELRIVSDAFGEEKERVWEWCDVLVLPTLSENFGLVVAEALERGKRVITTDGAPVWGEGRSGGVEEWVSGGVERGGVVNRVERVDRVERDGSLEFRVGSLELEKGEIWCGYGGRLLYLKGFRDGTREMRVELLKKAIVGVGEG